jgi:hypothetical protein
MKQFDLSVFTHHGRLVMVPLTDRAKFIMDLPEGAQGAWLDEISPMDLLVLFPDDFIVGKERQLIDESKIVTLQMDKGLH